MQYIKDITDFIFLEDEVNKSDIIFVPGNRYPQASEHAADLYVAGFAPYVLPSGHHSILLDSFGAPLHKLELYSGPYDTEYAFMRDVLVKNGVAQSAIIKEDQATYTYQNALYSKAALDKLNINIRRAIISCKNVHARRCKMYYETVFPDVQLLISPVTIGGVTRENWMNTAQGIDEVLGELERCAKQFGGIIKQHID